MHFIMHFKVWYQLVQYWGRLHDDSPQVYRYIVDNIDWVIQPNSTCTFPPFYDVCLLWKKKIYRIFFLILRIVCVQQCMLLVVPVHVFNLNKLVHPFPLFIIKHPCIWGHLFKKGCISSTNWYCHIKK